MPTTSYYGWTTPAEFVSSFHTIMDSYWSAADAVVGSHFKIAATEAWESVVISLYPSATTSLPMDSTFRTLSVAPYGPARGYFTVQGSGTQVLFDLRVSVEASSGPPYTITTGHPVYFRLAVDNTSVTANSVWRMPLYESRRQFNLAVSTIVSLGVGVHSATIETMGVVGGSQVSYYWVSTATRLILTATEVWRKLPYREAVMQDGPLAYWRLGDSDTSTAVDWSGNARHGIYTNTCTRVLMPGLLRSEQADGAIYISSFDNTMDYVRCGDILDMTSHAPYSIDFVIKPDSCVPTSWTPGPTGVIFSKFQAQRGGYGVGWTSSWNLVHFRVAGAGGTTLYSPIGSAGSVPPSVMTHAAIVFTGSLATGTRLEGYINGTLVYSATPVQLNSIFLRNTTLTTFIGAMDSSAVGSAHATFSGVIDEVAVYSGVVTAARILSHYRATQP